MYNYVYCVVHLSIMSLIFSTEEGWIISHLKYLNNIYTNVKNDNTQCKLIFNEILFDINSQYLRQNQTIQSEQQEGISLQSKTKKRKRLKLLPDEDLKEVCSGKQRI